MQYRRFGGLDWKASALGFGCMRLPTHGGDHSAIDEPEATRMLHYAIEHGVNYVDTAYPYHGGDSELVVGRALKGPYRDRVRLATKLPCWLADAPVDFDRYLNEQLRKLQVEHTCNRLGHHHRDRSGVLFEDLLWEIHDVSAQQIPAQNRLHHIPVKLHVEYRFPHDLRMSEAAEA